MKKKVNKIIKKISFSSTQIEGEGKEEARKIMRAMEFIKKGKADKLSPEELILTLHKIVMEGEEEKNPGQYRTVQVFIGGSSHVPPRPQFLHYYMEEIYEAMEEIKNKRGKHVLPLIAELHKNFVVIHPFVDGNGRVGRVLINWATWRCLKKFCLIRNEDRAGYIKALDEEDIEGLTKLIKKGLM